MTETRPLQILIDTLPQIGSVEWIGLRPSKQDPMVEVKSVQAITDKGLEGDRFNGRSGNPRQITLIQFEHLSVIAACLNRDAVSVSLLRRNIVVSGINLLALKNKRFCVGSAVLEYTGLCQPCSKMERQLGKGGYNAMRGHGGITAKIIKAGLIQINDKVYFAENDSGI